MKAFKLFKVSSSFSASRFISRCLGAVKERWEKWVPWEWKVRDGIDGSLHFFIHACSYAQPKHLQHFYPRLPTPEEVDCVLKNIAKKYKLISTGEYVERVERRMLKGNKILATVSCDDGLRQFKTYLWPIMKKYSIPCTLFIVKNFVKQKEYFYRFKTSLILNSLNKEPEKQERARECLVRSAKVIGRSIDTKIGLKKAILEIHEPKDHFILEELAEILEVPIERYFEATKPFLDVGEVTELCKEGVRLGSHGVCHHRYELLSPDEVRKDILDGVEYIQELSGQSTVEHAFPFNGDKVSREYLHKILCSQSVLTHFFDSGGIRRDAPFVTHRITLDGDPKHALRTAAYQFMFSRFFFPKHSRR
jgi:peptidoglycan/xylan/chitin deacetylase (PgdA/CDA1 family)